MSTENINQALLNEIANVLNPVKASLKDVVSSKDENPAWAALWDEFAEKIESLEPRGGLASDPEKLLSAEGDGFYWLLEGGAAAQTQDPLDVSKLNPGAGTTAYVRSAPGLPAAAATAVEMTCGGESAQILAATLADLFAQFGEITPPEITSGGGEMALMMGFSGDQGAFLHLFAPAEIGGNYLSPGWHALDMATGQPSLDDALPALAQLPTNWEFLENFTGAELVSGTLSETPALRAYEPGLYFSDAKDGLRFLMGPGGGSGGGSGGDVSEILARLSALEATNAALQQELEDFNANASAE
jgi:hypothetical protein